MAISSRMRAVGASLVTVLVLAAASASLNAQDSKKAKADGGPRRVPAMFGQIGLTGEQKETIYKIQDKHQAKIDELEKQIDEIQALMMTECEGVLTDVQKKLLQDLRKEAGTKKKGKTSK